MSPAANNNSTQKPLLSVGDALARVVAGVAEVVLGRESLSLVAGEESLLVGRIAAEDIVARLTHPPRAVSAMDGYAVVADDTQSAAPDQPARFCLIGESAAGSRFAGRITSGECVRISTGGVLPHGADAIAILEDTTSAGDQIALTTPAVPGRFIRAKGQDFNAGDTLVTKGTAITPRAIGLLAAAGITQVHLRQRPRIAILTTGSELVAAGVTPDASKGQIVSSNGVMLAAMVRRLGGVPVLSHDGHSIIADDRAKLAQAIDRVAGEADMLVVTGGASVGVHDTVAQYIGDEAHLDFWRIAMRPGKPMLFGHLPRQHKPPLPILGLPGNPVSAGVCGLIFVRAAINTMLGLPADIPQAAARLATPIPHPNDAREEYMRVQFASPPSQQAGDQHQTWVSPLPQQDSGRLKDFAGADALLIRPPYAPGMQVGDWVRIIRLDTI